MSDKVRRRIVCALLVSILVHIGFLVWSYFAKILPAIPFPERPETVFHVKIDREEHLGRENPKFDTESSRKSQKPDSAFTEKAAMPSVESEELIKDKIESSIQKNKQALIPTSVQENQVLKKADLN